MTSNEEMKSLTCTIIVHNRYKTNSKTQGRRLILGLALQASKSQLNPIYFPICKPYLTSLWQHQWSNVNLCHTGRSTAVAVTRGVTQRSTNTLLPISSILFQSLIFF